MSINGDDAPITSRSGAEPERDDWRGSIARVEGFVSNIAAEQVRSFDGLRAEHRTQREQLERLEAQVVVMTAAVQHQSQAYIDQSHRLDVLGRSVDDLKRGQEAMGRTLEFLGAEVRGFTEGLKGVVATKGEVAEVRDRAQRNSDRIDKVEQRADETGRHVIQVVGKRNEVLETGEQARQKWIRGLVGSLVLLLVGGILERACSGGFL